MQRLIRQDSGATPELVEVPSSHDGLSWLDLVRKVMQRASESDIAMNALAVIRGDDTFECPKPDMGLQTGDIVLLSVGECSQFEGVFWYLSDD